MSRSTVAGLLSDPFTGPTSQPIVWNIEVLPQICRLNHSAMRQDLRTYQTGLDSVFKRDSADASISPFQADLPDFHSCTQQRPHRGLLTISEVLNSWLTLHMHVFVDDVSVGSPSEVISRSF